MDDTTKLHVVSILAGEVFDCDKCDDASFMFAILCTILDVINDKKEKPNE